MSLNDQKAGTAAPSLVTEFLETKYTIGATPEEEAVVNNVAWTTYGGLSPFNNLCKHVILKLVDTAASDTVCEIVLYFLMYWLSTWSDCLCDWYFFVPHRQESPCSKESTGGDWPRYWPQSPSRCKWSTRFTLYWSHLPGGVAVRASSRYWHPTCSVWRRRRQWLFSAKRFVCLGSSEMSYNGT